MSFRSYRPPRRRQTVHVLHERIHRLRRPEPDRHGLAVQIEVERLAGRALVRRRQSDPEGLLDELADAFEAEGPQGRVGDHEKQPAKIDRLHDEADLPERAGRELGLQDDRRGKRDHRLDEPPPILVAEIDARRAERRERLARPADRDERADAVERRGELALPAGRPGMTVGAHAAFALADRRVVHLARLLLEGAQEQQRRAGVLLHDLEGVRQAQLVAPVMEHERGQPGEDRHREREVARPGPPHLRDERDADRGPENLDQAADRPPLARTLRARRLAVDRVTEEKTNDDVHGRAARRLRASGGERDEEQEDGQGKPVLLEEVDHRIPPSLLCPMPAPPPQDLRRHRADYYVLIITTRITKSGLRQQLSSSGAGANRFGTNQRPLLRGWRRLI